MAAPDAPSSRPVRGRTAGGKVNGVLDRLRTAWRGLDPNQRLAGIAALALLVTLFLPWYQKSVPTGKGSIGHETQSAIASPTFVEAAILVVVFGVLLLLLARGERRPFHLPGGDGLVITLAGLWAGFLVVWRVFDKPEFGQGVTVQLRWGMAVAIGAAVVLAYAGLRVRRAHIPEPPIREDELPDRRRDARSEVPVGGDRPWLAETEALPPRTRRPPPGDQAETVALPGEVPRPEDPPEAPPRRG